jgi:hypothetical protein
MGWRNHTSIRVMLMAAQSNEGEMVVRDFVWD